MLNVLKRLKKIFKWKHKDEIEASHQDIQLDHKKSDNIMAKIASRLILDAKRHRDRK